MIYFLLRLSNEEKNELGNEDVKKNRHYAYIQQEEEEEEEVMRSNIKELKVQRGAKLGIDHCTVGKKYKTK